MYVYIQYVYIYLIVQYNVLNYIFLLLVSAEIDRLRNQLVDIQKSEDIAVQELFCRKEEINKLKKDILSKDNEIMLLEERYAVK